MRRLTAQVAGTSRALSPKYVEDAIFFSRLPDGKIGIGEIPADARGFMRAANDRVIIVSSAQPPGIRSAR